MKSAEVIEVIKTVNCDGNGTNRSPYRNVTTYWDLDGKFLAKDDPHEKVEMDKEDLEMLLGECRVCGETPDYSSSGHRGHKDCTVFHDCSKLPGSPQVIFTVSEWKKNNPCVQKED